MGCDMHTKTTSNQRQFQVLSQNPFSWMFCFFFFSLAATSTCVELNMNMDYLPSGRCSLVLIRNSWTNQLIGIFVSKQTENFNWTSTQPSDAKNFDRNINISEQFWRDKIMNEKHSTLWIIIMSNRIDIGNTNCSTFVAFECRLISDAENVRGL